MSWGTKRPLCVWGFHPVTRGAVFLCVCVCRCRGSRAPRDPQWGELCYTAQRNTFHLEHTGPSTARKSVKICSAQDYLTHSPSLVTDMLSPSCNRTFPLLLPTFCPILYTLKQQISQWSDLLSQCCNLFISAHSAFLSKPGTHITHSAMWLLTVQTGAVDNAATSVHAHITRKLIQLCQTQLCIGKHTFRCKVSVPHSHWEVP